MARGRSNTPDQVKNAPPLDLAALAAQAVTVKPRTGGGRYANNPYVPLVRESYKLHMDRRNGWKGNTVPGFHVRDLNGALRHAGMTLNDDGIGVRIRFEYRNDAGELVEHGNVREVPEDGRDVTVKYLGTKRRVYLDDDQVKDAIERGFILTNKDGEVQTDKDGNPRPDTAAYLRAMGTDEPNGDTDDDADDDPDADDPDNGTFDDDDQVGNYEYDDDADYDDDDQRVS